MFGWFKKKEKDSSERFRDIAMTFQGLENGLKGVENHWHLGNKKEGDTLFDAVYRACIGNFLDGPRARPDDIKLLQFEGIKRLTHFLDRHSRYKEANELILKLPSHFNDFDQEQLAFLIHWMNVHKEALQARTGNADVRLIYYVCQSCGKMNLLLTAPCIHCGFSCKTRQEVRRGLFLSPNVLSVPVLMHLALQLQSGQSKTPPITIDKVWSAGAFDDVVRRDTQSWEAIVEDHLNKSIARAGTFLEPQNLEAKCNSCGKSQIIYTDRMVQKCAQCNSPLAIPVLRRVKASLLDSLNLMVCFSDHSDDVNYSNFVGAWVLVTDYALRRDAYPTKAQGLNLIDRFSSLSPMSYMSGRVELKLDAGRVVANFSTSDPIDPQAKPFIDQQVSTINILFDLFRANELQV